MGPCPTPSSPRCYANSYIRLMQRVVSLYRYSSSDAACNKLCITIYRDALTKTRCTQKKKQIIYVCALLLQLFSFRKSQLPALNEEDTSHN